MVVEVVTAVEVATLDPMYVVVVILLLPILPTAMLAPLDIAASLDMLVPLAVEDPVVMAAGLAM